MSTHNPLIPVILSGGTGARLWPVSRESHPKPFIQLADGQSLLQKAFLRACAFTHAAEILTITNQDYYLKTKAEYEKINHHHIKSTYLLEPSARNTAPAIALAALKVQAEYGDEAILLILPADHLIEDIASFQAHCLQAFTLANENKLVTFGITPTAPETGFGYIECDTGHTVTRFVEKPDLTTAERYIGSGRYLWNAGMFCFKAGVILEQFSLHQPSLLAAAKECWDLSQQTSKHPAVIEIDAKHFAKLENISIDYAIMEKSQHIAVVACDYTWQDIGSWEAYKKLFDTDEQANVILGDAVVIDSQNNFIHSEGRMVAAIGINNLTIIDTPDALLIADGQRTQEVKQVVQNLKYRAHESYLTHRTVIRPWGSYTVLEEGPAFKIKRIVVKPQASLSLQLHQQRSEHWVVVEGVATVTIADKTYQLQTNESTFVPIGTPHRLSNAGDKDLVMIEVQTGLYLGEDDIVRLEDTYGRKTTALEVLT